MPGDDDAGPGESDRAIFVPGFRKAGAGADRSGEESSDRERHRGLDPGRNRGGEPHGGGAGFEEYVSSGACC